MAGLFAPLLTVLLILGFSSVAFFLWRIRMLRKLDWSETTEHPHNDIKSEGIAGNWEEPWLFAGPPSNEAQDKHKLAVHRPVYFMRILYLWVIRSPRFLCRMLTSSIRDKQICYIPIISDEDIYEFFVSSPLLVMAKFDGQYLDFQLDPMPLRTLQGTNPSPLHLIMDANSKTLIKAEWKGQSILEDKPRIFSLVIIVLTLWAHPQTHVAAEQSAREIARKKIQELEPSNRFVVALHEGLLYNPYSPLANDQPLSINFDRDAGLESVIQYKVPHHINPQKSRFRYFKFLFEARKILYKQLKAHQIEVNAEHLFNNMIVHSVDHFFFYKNLKKMTAWSLDGGSSIASYWRSQIFVAIWVRHVSSPIEQEKIGKLSPKKYPFYHELYQQLSLIDRELANSILTSTSF